MPTVTNIHNQRKQQQSNHVVKQPSMLASTSLSSTTTTKFKQQHQANKRKLPLLTPKEEEFKWLHWVYSQWKHVEPGTKFLEENVIKQMIALIPYWAWCKDMQSEQRSEELLERLIQEALIDYPYMISLNSTYNAQRRQKSTPM
jgi:hypothetical protein